jgi:hypothetical protein
MASATMTWDSTYIGKNTYWKTVTIQSLGADSLYYGMGYLTGCDTSVGARTYIPAGISVTINNVVATYVRTKSSTGTIKRQIVVTVGTPSTIPQVMTFSGAATGAKKIDTVLTRITATYWRSFVATDSIKRVHDALQYSANDVMTNDSVAARAKFFAFNAAAQNGGRFIITDVQVSIDSLNSTNGNYLLVFDKDSSLTNHIADNATYLMLGSNFGNRVGEITGGLQQTGMTANTSTTLNAWDYQTGVNLQGGAATNSTYVYARWVWLAAFTPPFNGTVRIKIKGLQEVLPQ